MPQSWPDKGGPERKAPSPAYTFDTSPGYTFGDATKDWTETPRQFGTRPGPPDSRTPQIPPRTPPSSRSSKRSLLPPKGPSTHLQRVGQDLQVDTSSLFVQGRHALVDIEASKGPHPSDNSRP